MSTYDLTSEPDRSLRNNPPPADVSAFQKELDKAGFVGSRPRFRIVWGQSEREWARGANRIKYPIPFKLEKKDIEWAVAIPDPGTKKGKTLKGYQFKGMRLRYSTQAECEEYTKKGLGYLTFNKLNSWDVQWVGRPRYVIEVLIPDIGETPETWESRRYRYHFENKGSEWIPKTYSKEHQRWIEDDLGPFPGEGRYVFFMDVKKYDGTPLGEYKLPDDETLAIWKESAFAPVNINYHAEEAFKESHRVWEENEETLRQELDLIAKEYNRDIAPKVGWTPSLTSKAYAVGKAH